MGLEISGPILLYIRSKSEILTGNPEVLWDILEISQKSQKQAIFGAFPAKWDNGPHGNQKARKNKNSAKITGKPGNGCS